MALFCFKEVYDMKTKIRRYKNKLEKTKIIKRKGERKNEEII